MVFFHTCAGMVLQDSCSIRSLFLSTMCHFFFVRPVSSVSMSCVNGRSSGRYRPSRQPCSTSSHSSSTAVYKAHNHPYSMSHRLSVHLHNTASLPGERSLRSAWSLCVLSLPPVGFSSPPFHHKNAPPATFTCHSPTLHLFHQFSGVNEQTLTDSWVSVLCYYVWTECSFPSGSACFKSLGRDLAFAL